MSKLFLSLLFFCWVALLMPALFIVMAIVFGFLPDHMSYVALYLVGACLPIVGVAVSVFMFQVLKEIE